ncbi:hypothetical protein AGMMS50256_03850 [Betaproteobacteria bacterium]|nr:hypothetical protein AGMMS50256_03850 [Betaproteobacteria bacterium]
MGEDARRAGEGAAVQRETGLEQARILPLSCPCRGTLSHKGERESKCLFMLYHDQYIHAIAL